MERFWMWFKWFFGILMNAAIVLYVAWVADFPLWIAITTLLVLDGLPLLWIVGVIPHSLNINASFVGGFWFSIQIMVLIVSIFLSIPLLTLTSPLDIVMLVFLAFFVYTFFKFRIKVEVKILQKYS